MSPDHSSIFRPFGGSTSQDLKTGYLVGGTPRAQQIAILVGAFASALILAPNKTLAAQLFSEFKSFFPENAVGNKRRIRRDR